MSKKIEDQKSGLYCADTPGIKTIAMEGVKAIIKTKCVYVKEVKMVWDTIRT